MFRKKILIKSFILQLLLLSGSVFAILECQDEILTGTTCDVFFPSTDCSSITYDLVNSAKSIVLNDHPWSTFSGGICNFVFNQTAIDSYSVDISDNNMIHDLRVVGINTFRGNISNILDNQTTLLTEIDSVEENQATILANLNDNFTWINNSIGSGLDSQQNETLFNITFAVDEQLNISHEEGNWSATGAGLAASVNNTAVAEAVWAYATRTLSSYGTLIADIWNYAYRFIHGVQT